MTLDESTTLVRNDMGEEAIIISSYQSKDGRGAEVTAALDEADDDELLATTITTSET